MFRIPVQLHDQVTEAVIDTAAEVTLISDRLFKRFSVSTTVIKQVTMNTAGRDLQMKGHFIACDTEYIYGYFFIFML